MTDACSFWLSSKNLTKTYCTVTVHIRDLAHIMETKIFKRKPAILNDIAGRVFVIGMFLSGTELQNLGVMDWVLLTITSILGLSIIQECVRLFRPLLVLQEGDQLIFLGIFKSIQISKVSFRKKLGQRWIALESDQKKKVGNIMVKDLNEESIQTIRDWS